MATQFKLCIKLLILLIIFTPISSYSEQYQSDEIGNAKPRSAQEQKSIQELEEDIDTLEDTYSKQSTARFLARHYVQQNSEAAIKKAIEYYLMALKGDGLSIYAKQATLKELLALYFHHEMYLEYLNGYSNYLQLQGKPSTALQIKRMLSLYRLSETRKAHKVAKALFSEYEKDKLALGVEELKQLLFVLYNVEDFLASIQVQKRIVALDEYSVEQWLRLSKLYIKSDQPNEAASVLLASLQKGLLGDQASLLFTVDLIRMSGNPLIAARLLEELLDQYYVDHNESNYDRLFEYWYLAQELDLAANALEKALEYGQSTERFIDLSELYYQQQNWEKMNSIIKQACQQPIGKQYFGRVSLLLGVSELKLNKKSDAINALQLAAMDPNQKEQAAAYLRFLGAEVIQPKPSNLGEIVCKLEST